MRQDFLLVAKVVTIGVIDVVESPDIISIEFAI